MFNREDGATITLVRTNEEYHTYRDFNLIITNACSISAPEMHEDYIVIKGRNGVLDVSEALTGKPTYKSRHISVSLAGIYEARDWDDKISILRNLLEGQTIKITFDNDLAYYWTGRAHLIDFQRDNTCGMFTLDIPQAEPYKYNVQAFNEDWLWDPFNFETGIVTTATTHTITSQTDILIPAGQMPVSPTIIVNKINTFLSVQKYGESRVIQLKPGENKVFAITVNGRTESTLTFRGSGTFSINFRGGSL